jgi:protein-S-isoprenylcysteine O-methyltransferase Ste14
VVIMMARILRLAGLAATIAVWVWARDAERSPAGNLVLIWCAPLLAYPVTLAGRRALDAHPLAIRAERVNVPVHFAMMMALGAGIFPAIRLAAQSPGTLMPVPRPLALALLIVTGVAAAAAVANLALRGLGAPFAVKLSSRLATGWMYAWTRNPMLLATLSFLLSLGLWNQSRWFVVWLVTNVAPGLIFFVWWYEERELSLRFGPPYDAYRERTPMLLPRRPN